MNNWLKFILMLLAISAFWGSVIWAAHWFANRNKPS